MSVIEASGPFGNDAYDLAVLGLNPIAYYKQADASVVLARDSSPHLFHGAYTANPTLRQPGLLAHDNGDTSVQYDGVTQFLTTNNGAPLVAALNAAPSKTYCIWFKFTTLPQFFLFGRDASGAERGASLWTNNGQVLFGNSGVAFVTSPLQYNDGNPHFAVGVYDNPTTNWTLYVDNVKVVGPTAFANPETAINGVWVAARGGTGNFFPGTCEKASVHPFAFAAADVNTLWSNR